MNIEKVVQVKLVNGEELLACYENYGEVSDEMRFSYVLSMVPVEFDVDEVESDKSYYILRPFISYANDLSNIISINPNTIIALATPSDAVVEQFNISVNQIQDTLGKGKSAKAMTSADNVVSLRPRTLTED